MVNPRLFLVQSEYRCTTVFGYFFVLSVKVLNDKLSAHFYNLL